MTLLGMEMNSTRARAVIGPPAEYPLPLPLDPPALELPLVLSLEKKTAQVGQGGLRLVRQMPHLACQNFLASVGQPEPRWHSGRHRLDSSAAMTVVWQRLALVAKGATGIALALPGYLSRQQALLVKSLGHNQRIPILGSLPTCLVAALAAAAEGWWLDAVLVVDVDDYALSLAFIQARDGKASVSDERHIPLLGLRHWKERLVNALADLCVRQSRRDPRDAPAAEQSLYEQLDAVLECCLQGRFIQVAVQATHWYQNLLLQPEQTLASCGRLALDAQREIENFLTTVERGDAPPVMLLTARAARLPGLVPHLRQLAEDAFLSRGDAARKPRNSAIEDFGEDLLRDNGDELPLVAILPADSPARGMHALARLFLEDDLPRGHLTDNVPLPAPAPLEAGPPRLQFQGQDFMLYDTSFFLGTLPACQLAFDPMRHPGVAPKHCEIVFDYRRFVLVDRSRDGTLVNDHPVAGSVVLHSGDWIRLGERGPLVRFLGASNGRALTTIA